MKTIIYRNNSDNSIYRVEGMQKYFDYGKTEEEVIAQAKKFNEEHSEKTSLHVEILDVPASVEEIFKIIVTESTILFGESILHPCDEEVPANTLLYVFRKHPDHNIPAMSVIRLHSNGVKLPEIRDNDNMLPIAWCKAKDLIDHIGMTKAFINQQTKRAKSLAWGWYKE